MHKTMVAGQYIYTDTYTVLLIKCSGEQSIKPTFVNGDHRGDGCLYISQVFGVYALSRLYPVCILSETDFILPLRAFLLYLVEET